MTYLLDTNILSEVRKPSPHRHVAAWFRGVATADLRLSVLALGEVRRGVAALHHRGDLRQAETLAAWLAGLPTAYADRLVAVSAPIAETWGRLSVPDPLPVIDGLLAATALVHDWTLVTRNTAQVARTGVRLLNPFQPPAA